MRSVIVEIQYRSTSMADVKVLGWHWQVLVVAEWRCGGLADCCHGGLLPGYLLPTQHSLDEAVRVMTSLGHVTRVGCCTAY